MVLTSQVRYKKFDVNDRSLQWCSPTGNIYADQKSVFFRLQTHQCKIYPVLNTDSHKQGIYKKYIYPYPNYSVLILVNGKCPVSYRRKAGKIFHKALVIFLLQRGVQFFADFKQVKCGVKQLRQCYLEEYIFIQVSCM